MRKKMKRLFEAFALLLLTTGAANAATVTVTESWFRSLPSNLPAGGYFTARNSGKTDLAITGAKSPACGMLMLHKSSDKGGMSGMAMVDRAPLPAGGSITFAPGGFHLMCVAPKMKIGGTVPVAIQLSDGTAVTANFAVKDARGK
jgi:copper(I)-binding protein